MSRISPLRREVVVPASPETAFRVFTDQIGSWWPLADLSVFGQGASVSFEDGELVETAADGGRSLWGTVTAWVPGQEVAFTWHPGRDSKQASRVTVTFTATEDATLVTVVHDGWEVFADPAAARGEYDRGWPMVLGCFERDAARAA